MPLFIFGIDRDLMRDVQGISAAETFFRDLIFCDVRTLKCDV